MTIEEVTKAIPLPSDNDRAGEDRGQPEPHRAGAAADAGAHHAGDGEARRCGGEGTAAGDDRELGGVGGGIGVTQSEASVRQAEVTASKADADLARLSDLYSHSAVAEKEVLSAKTALALAATSGVEQAKTAREQARRRLELLGLTPGRSDQAVTVAAPLSGKVWS